ncbi:MAG: hypothetical protein EXS05_17960 [Planctomycetaceae bacterium]|nr:hypothetical protein [Planctomycetaceae bacterium]
MSTAPPRHGDHGTRGVWIVIGTIAVVILAAWLLMRSPPNQENDPVRERRPPGGDQSQLKFSADDCQRLTELKNRALAHLERNAYESAIEILEPLAKQLPDEPAAIRNLVIARLMALDKGEDVPGLDEQLTRAREVEPDSPVPHRLAARAAIGRRLLATGQGNSAAAAKWETVALRELDAAIAKSPDDPSLWLEIAEIADNPADANVKSRKAEALKQAYAKAPGNLAVTTRRLVNQVEEHDPDVIETIAAARELFQPLAESVQQRARNLVTVKDLLDQAQGAAEKQDWNQATARIRTLHNVILPEDWCRSDNHRVHNRHVLEFVVQNFRSVDCPDPSTLASADRPALQFVRRAGDDALPAIDGSAVRELRIADFDLNGLADVLVLNANRLDVYGRDDLTKPWARLAGVDLPGGARGLLIGDLDREGVPTEKGMAARQRDKKPKADAGACQSADLDVVIFGSQGVLVFRNEMNQEGGLRQLVAVEQEPAFQSLVGVLAGLLVDFDHDGDLDLVLSTETGLSLWLNRGDARFYDVTARSQLPPGTLQATAFVAVDWDHDLDLDVLAVGLGSVPAGYLENLRHGQFRWREFEGELAALSPSATLSLLDDARGSWDVIAGGTSGLRRVGTRTSFEGSISGADLTEISKTVPIGTVTADWDNDSFTDLVAWNSNGCTLYRGLGQGKFQDESALFDAPPNQVTACAIGDLDGDGDLDLVVAERETVTIFDNDGGNKNGWVDVRIRGEEDGANGSVNQLGIGSLIELRAGPFYRKQVVTDQVTHFGLGKRDRADVLRVIWSNGVPQVILDPAVNQTICEQHLVIVSCPLLYAWNGLEFEFFTDLLWNAPLGLQLAEGVIAQPRAWEYLKIDGDRFQPRDGKYVLQVTGELWEADYFDHVELIAVDHPADVEIFSNEKVGPAEIAEFKVHTVRQPRTPVAARNARGEDVLEIVAKRDGAYLKGHTFNYCKGLTDDHFLELDLGDLKEGDLKDARQVSLFLTGWIYPSDTSIRVAASQNPNFPASKPPALWVPDAAGEWREVRPFMGFPGGKTKTIAVDLSGVFLTDDYRVRIVTNWEFYWDHAFFSVDEQPAPLQMTTLPVAAADLHYRGFSAVVPNPGWGPETYDYSRVNTEPNWPPMQGFFTRYGDVTELLKRQDDLQVILASGDEMTVTFDVPPVPLPQGWKRDFLLHNVGWDKDAVLNTVYGQTVEPLPFHGMSGYPYGPDEKFPETPAHQEYLRRYQTRTQPAPRFWRQVRDHAIDRTPSKK